MTEVKISTIVGQVTGRVLTSAALGTLHPLLGLRVGRKTAYNLWEQTLQGVDDIRKEFRQAQMNRKVEVSEPDEVVEETILQN